MKERFTLMISALLLFAVGAMAATDYGFKVGGVSVTSDNYNNVTGSNITSGTVKYVPSENKLYMTDVVIERTGKGNRAIYNESCKNLKIIFKGTNKLSAKNAAPLRFQVDTYIMCEDGGRAKITGVDEDAICPYNGSILRIWDACLEVEATNSRAFEGNNSGGVIFQNSTVSATGKYGALSRLRYVQAIGDDTKLDLYGNNSAVTVNEVANMELTIGATSGVYANTKILTPSEASYSSSQKAIVTSSAPSGYKGKIVIQTANPIMADVYTISDPNFRAFVFNSFDKNHNYILGTKELEAIEDIDYHSQNCYTLKGIEYFTSLKKLDCSDNKLTSLDISKLTNLTILRCTDNQLTSLNVKNNTKLMTLYCYRNKLNATAMQTLISDLPTRTDQGILVPLYTISGETNALLTKEQVNQANRKRWYVYYKANASDLGYSVFTGNETTGIDAAETDVDAIPDNAPLYNLNGQRVPKDYKGIVIYKGKKIVR